MAFTPGGLLRRFFGSAVSNAAGYAIGGAITPVLEPLTQDLANEAWSAHPVKPLSPAQAAAGALREVPAGIAWDAEAARSGVSGERFAALTQLQGEAPPTAMVLDLLRRAEITAGQADTAFARNGLIESWRAQVRKLAQVLPSVTDMVRFAVREVYDPGQRAALDLDAEFPGAFAADAERIGLNRETAGNYWAAHWELPSYTQATEMLFRGEISSSEFSGLLKALDYAPTWRGPLEAIARRIPTITDMIRFAVREVYNPPLRQSLGIDAEYPSAFTPQAALHGMSEEHARQYWAAHWRLPSAQQGYRMLWRGEISEAQLDDLLKALDYPPVWRDRLANIARIVPGRVDLRRMYRANVIDRAEVLAGYQRLGYSAQDAETLTAFADAEKAGGSSAKNETAAELRDEHEGGYITDAELRDGLAALGYDAREVEALASLGAARQVKHERGRVVTAIHKLFVKGSIDEARAREVLLDAGMRPEAVGRVIVLWTLERDAAG